MKKEANQSDDFKKLRTKWKKQIKITVKKRKNVAQNEAIKINLCKIIAISVATCRHTFGSCRLPKNDRSIEGRYHQLIDCSTETFSIRIHIFELRYEFS